MLISEVRTRQGAQPIKAYSKDEIILLPVPFEKWTTNRVVREYAADFAVLDTETSHADLLRGWVYQWAVKWQGQYIYGRTPLELVEFLQGMQQYYHLNNKRRIIFYIHNASYDMQYLKRWFMSLGDLHVMATDNHTFLITDVGGFRFLCSYKLSNMSLNMFSATYADEYLKAAGEIDYTVVRYQDSPLTDTDWRYMFSDIASQYDALTEYLKINGYDRAYKAPYTSTGFVRAICRKAAAGALNWHKKFLVSALTLDKYQLCRRAFMGGITIQSWLWEGETIRVGQNGVQKIGHVDFRSSYPARQMMNYMPVGRGFWWGDVTKENFDFLLNTYCCVFILHLKGVQIKEGITAPYIPSSKCIGLNYSNRSVLKINGKIVAADELHIAITELDYKWIKRQYTAEETYVTDMLCFNRGKAPDWLRCEVMRYFTLKCTTDKKSKRYDWTKSLLNAIYGMTATAICRDSFVLEDCCIVKTESDYEEQIKHFYNSRNSFMPYQLSLYTTAAARDALMTVIFDCVGYDKFLYCDTDSVFYISTPEIEEKIAQYNKEITARAMAAGAYVGDKVLGVATEEPEVTAFRGLHAKCYAIEEWNDKKQDYCLKVTIAGIPKESTKWIDGKPVTMTNAEELGIIDNLRDGFVFKHCGGTRTIYIEDEPHEEVINGHKTQISSAAIIENIEKEISNTMWTRAADYSLLHIECAESL